MARLSRRTGGILFYQEQTIERILTLQEKMAKDVMTPRTVVFSLSEHLTLQETINGRPVDGNTAGYLCITRE